MSPEESNQSAASRPRGRRREEEGTVTSDGMDKTVVVTVERVAAHPMYGKVVRTRNKFLVHDGENSGRVGDRVRIVECRPISRRKRWRLAEVIEQAPLSRRS